MSHFNLIRKWAADRNLIEGATVHAQFVKLIEESGELAAGIAKNRPEEIKDGIGDMVVVLTILAAQNGLTIEECIAAAYEEIKDRKGRMIGGMFVKEADLPVGPQVGDLVEVMHSSEFYSCGDKGVIFNRFGDDVQIDFNTQNNPHVMGRGCWFANVKSVKILERVV
jgi:NTP pyrophosphatase (non-canonical NTP hydrolase)